MVWKCRCGHFNDYSFEECFTCGAPQPGRMKQGEIEYTIILDYVHKGIAEMRTVFVKGPVTISTDAEHTRAIIAGIVTGGASTEFASYEWANGAPHGSPIQIYPLAEGGFEVSCASPMFMIDGVEPSANKTTVESGTILTMSDTMIIKLEDCYGPAFMKGGLSPVGDRPPEDVPEEILYRPQNSKWYYYNGLSSFACSMYTASGLKMHTPSSNSDINFLNTFILREYGIKLKRAKDTLKELSES